MALKLRSDATVVGLREGNLQIHGRSRESLSTGGTGFPRTCLQGVKPAPHISWGAPVFGKIKFNVNKSTERFGSRGELGGL